MSDDFSIHTNAIRPAEPFKFLWWFAGFCGSTLSPIALVLGGACVFVGLLSLGRDWAGVILAVLYGLSWALTALGIKVVGEIVRLLLTLERNTRKD